MIAHMPSIPLCHMPPDKTHLGVLDLDFLNKCEIYVHMAKVKRNFLKRIENKLGLSCAKLSKLGARSLAELQIRIHWHHGMAFFSSLPTSWEQASHYLGLFTKPAVAGAGSLA